MKLFKNIREFIWPLLEQNNNSIKKKQSSYSVENGKRTYELLTSISAREDDRLKTIESKSAIFIGTMSVTTSVIVASFTVLANTTESNKYLICIYAVSLVLIVYLLRTLWFSVKALKRGKYAYISINEICHKSNNESDYYKKLSLDLIKSINTNRKAINSKVDSMVMAQEYFKRAIWTIGIYALSILFIFLDFSFVQTKQIFINLDWLEIIQWILIAISLILSIISFLYKRR